MRRDGFWGNVGRMLLPILLLCVISACGGNSATHQEELGAGVGPGIGMPIEDYPMEEMPVEHRPVPVEIPDDDIPDVGGAATSDFNPDEYTAVLDVTEKMELHQKGDLRVWIGREEYIPEEEPDMVRKTTTSFPGDEGNYARITPYAPDFTIEPEESQVMRITPSGSSVLFTIIPQKKGEFRISAKIELFDNPYFDGVPIPKTTNIVSVVVTVDPMVNLVGGLQKMGTVVWDSFMKFWGAIVALIFGALLFLTRRFIKSKTGFKGDGIESSSLGGEDDTTPSESSEITEASEEPASESGEEEEPVDYFDVADEDKQ